MKCNPNKNAFAGVLALFLLTLIGSLVTGFIGVHNFVGPQGLLDLYAECNGEPAGTYKINTSGGDSVLSGIKGSGQNGFEMMREEPTIAVLVMFGVFAIALLWLFLLRTYTRAMVWGTLLISFVVLVVAGIAAFLIGLQDLGIVFLSIAGLKLLYLLYVRKSVDVCADMLQLACEALIHYPSILASHMLLGLMVLVASLVTFVFMVMTEFNIVSFTGFECFEPKQAGYVKMFQSLHWACLLWFLGTITAARVFVSAFVAGQWYFHREEDRVQHATSKALLLAFTKSLGTLAFAGAINALLNWLKRKVRKMKTRCNPLLCLLKCLLTCLLNMIQYLNIFATIVASKCLLFQGSLQAAGALHRLHCFVCSAVTGESFINAGKASIPLLRGNFNDGFATDHYGRFVLEVGAVAVSFMGGFLAWFTFNDANQMDSFDNSA